MAPFPLKTLTAGTNRNQPNYTRKQCWGVLPSLMVDGFQCFPCFVGSLVSIILISKCKMSVGIEGPELSHSSKRGHIWICP